MDAKIEETAGACTEIGIKRLHRNNPDGVS